MSNVYYDLYCDESGIDRGIFYFGAIHCSRGRAGILSRSVTDFRAKYGMFSEMKWGNVSKSKLEEYKAFADIFLDDPFASFILSKVTKGRHWRSLGRSNDSIFMNAYFYFLEDAMLKLSHCRYSIFLDGSSIKQYRFDALRFCMNKPSMSYGRQKKVCHLEKVDSKKSNMVQLVDVVLGALTSEATAEHKIELSNHVKAKFARSVKSSGLPKLRVTSWSAPESRDFVPNL